MPVLWKDISHTKFRTCKGMLSAIQYWKLNEIESNYWNKSDLDNLLLSFIMCIIPFIRAESCVFRLTVVADWVSECVF